MEGCRCREVVGTEQISRVTAFIVLVLVGPSAGNLAFREKAEASSMPSASTIL